MKFYLTYFTKVFRDKEYAHFDAEFTKFLMKKCIFFLKKHNYEAHLITDEYGKFLFKDLEWNSVDTSLESLPSVYSEVWSFGKIKSYNIISLKGDPFVHIDYDAFILKPLEKFVLESDVIIESKEICKHRCYNKDIFHKKCKNKFFAINKYLDFAYNCGIVGGKNLDFFYNYSKSALDMLFDESNQSFWIDKQEGFRSFTKAILLEQYYLSSCLDYFNIHPFIFYKEMCKINNIKPRKYYTPNDNFVNNTIGYVHFYGHFKDSLKLLYDKFERV
jgi:hypothetical protein